MRAHSISSILCFGVDTEHMRCELRWLGAWTLVLCVAYSCGDSSGGAADTGDAAAGTGGLAAGTGGFTVGTGGLTTTGSGGAGGGGGGFVPELSLPPDDSCARFGMSYGGGVCTGTCAKVRCACDPFPRSL